MQLLHMGQLADLVIWKPSIFGAKPEMVIKGGTIEWANMGDPNASIPTPEPVNRDIQGCTYGFIVGPRFSRLKEILFSLYKF